MLSTSSLLSPGSGQLAQRGGGGANDRFSLLRRLYQARYIDDRERRAMANNPLSLMQELAGIRTPTGDKKAYFKHVQYSKELRLTWPQSSGEGSAWGCVPTGGCQAFEPCTASRCRVLVKLVELHQDGSQITDVGHDQECNQDSSPNRHHRILCHQNRSTLVPLLGTPMVGSSAFC